MTGMGNPKHIWQLLIAVPFLLGGCSVLRVDVDVYNGPLANHEDVQIEQLAAMVMAAKPLLVQVRDTLQWDGECKDAENDERYLQCIQLEKHKRINGRQFREEQGIINSGGVDQDASGVLGYQASRINDLLSLYLDRNQAAVAETSPSSGASSAQMKDVVNGVEEFLRAHLAAKGDPSNAAFKEAGIGLVEKFDVDNLWDVLGTEQSRAARGLASALSEVRRKGEVSRDYRALTTRQARQERLLFALLVFDRRAAEDLLTLARAHARILNATRSPFSRSPDLATVKPESANDGVYPEPVGSLSQGRLDQGVATLVRDYLAKRLRCIEGGVSDCGLGAVDPDANLELGSDPDDRRKRLKSEAVQSVFIMEEAIVRFATKLLTIADLEVLLKPGSRSSELGFSALAESQLNLNVLVLQAIGNSILSQADENRRRRGYERGLRERSRVAWARTNLKDELGDLAGEIPAAEPKTVIEVFDMMITRLKYRHIALTSESGECSGNGKNASDEQTAAAAKSPEEKDLPAAKPAADQATGSARCEEARKVAAAIALAYEYRSGMIYIRPPSAYLRQVFAASGLQSDSGLAWSNMLESQAARSLPLANIFGYERIGDTAARDRRSREIRAEIDKQFWNNINSVRLAGFGATNFVLVKDDVGNWYAKNVAADPSDIYQSVQSSLLFAVGGNVNADLLLQRNLEREALSAEGGSYTGLLQNQQYVALRNQNRSRFNGESSGNLSPAFRAFRDDYVKAVNALAFDVRELITTDVNATSGLAADLRAITRQTATQFPAGLQPQVISETETAIAAGFASHMPNPGETVGAAAAGDLQAAAARAAQVETATRQLADLRKSLVKQVRTRAAAATPATCAAGTAVQLQDRVQTARQVVSGALAKLAAFQEAETAEPGKFTTQVANAAAEKQRADTGLSQAESALAQCRLQVQLDINENTTAAHAWVQLADRLETRINVTLQSWLSRQVSALDSFEQAIQVISKVASETAAASDAELPVPSPAPDAVNDESGAQ